MPDTKPRATNTKPKVVSIYEGRVTEDFLLQQYEFHVGQETYREQKSRMEDNDLLYAGELRDLFPDETAVPRTSLVENKFKNALHDLSRLAAGARTMPKSLPRGDRDKDTRDAKVREAIYDGYAVMNNWRLTSRQLFLDLIGSGMMAVAGYYDDTSVYPQTARLNPRFCWPDVRNGRLTSLIYAETLKERQAALMFPDFGLDADARSSKQVEIVGYYGPDENAESIIRIDGSGNAKDIYIFRRWRHDLGTPTVAFRMLDSFDGALRGLLDQMSGPMLARNKIVRYMIDYLESLAHSPIVEMGVQNKDAVPGPTTVYHLDDTVEKATIYRLPPAAPSGSVWSLLSYMDDQEQRESIQPPARVGQVTQSIASGSFVASTQGQLTSVVEELQENMGLLLRDLGVICNRIDESWLDETKPLVRPVGKIKTYLPSEAIAGWYYHTVEYGAAAGLDKINAENRLLQLLSARVIPRSVVADQVDFLDDTTSLRERIDSENVADALLQRFATDPATPIGALANVMTLMSSQGLTLVEALEKVAPELVAPPEAPEAPAEPTIAPAPAPSLQPPPLQQVLVR